MHRLPVVLILALAAGACGSDKAPAAAAPAEAKLVAKGKLASTLDGAPVTLDYDGIAAQITMSHRLNSDPKGYGCVAKLSLVLEKKDGACRLELAFAPSPNGPKLSSGKFYAAKTLDSGGQTVGLTKCDGWPGADKATKELAYDVLAGDLGLNMAPLGPGKANQKIAHLTGLKLTFSGDLVLKKLATKVTFPLKSFTLEGSVDSIGDAAADCGGLSGQTGAKQCSTSGKPGDSVGDIFRRENKTYLCDSEADYDLGELCGNDAIWIIDWRDWAQSQLLTQIGQVRDSFKGKNIGVAVVVVEGKNKVAVEDPPGSGTYKPNGPAPTAAECTAIASNAGVPKDVVMLFDKDKQMTYQGKQITSAKYVPSMLFCKPDGTIVKVLPDGSTTPSVSDLQAAIQQVLDTP